MKFEFHGPSFAAGMVVILALDRHAAWWTAPAIIIGWIAVSLLERLFLPRLSLHFESGKWSWRRN